MLDGIVMDIIHVPGIIGVISDLMFPKAPLAPGKLPPLRIGLPAEDAGPLGRRGV